MKQNDQGTVTVQDVARVAGVSVASVSRALNNGSVRPAMREKVKAAADKLGYVPHGAAQALKLRRSRTIGAIIPTLENPNFAVGVEAMQRHVMNAGYTLLLSSSNYDPNQEFAQVKTLVGRGVDGIMLVGSEHDPDLYQFLDSKKVPRVSTWVLCEEDINPSVGFDNKKAAIDLATYLLDLGHKDFGIIAGLSATNDRAQARVDGIQEALAKNGLSVPAQQLIEKPYKIFEGQLAMRSFLAMEKPPTAVICGNDLLAFGALTECQMQGVRVPDEVSIAGFDDLDFAARLVPPLTTIRVPADEIGIKAAEYLLARIENKKMMSNTEIEVNLVVRGSTGPSRTRRN